MPDARGPRRKNNHHPTTVFSRFPRRTGFVLYTFSNQIKLHAVLRLFCTTTKIRRWMPPARIWRRSRRSRRRARPLSRRREITRQQPRSSNITTSAWNLCRRSPPRSTRKPQHAWPAPEPSACPSPSGHLARRPREGTGRTTRGWGGKGGKGGKGGTAWRRRSFPSLTIRPRGLDTDF